MPGLQQIRRMAACSLLVCLSLARALPAQSVSDYQVKAAYLYNFAKFVEWPRGTFVDSSAPLRFCILEDRTFQDELSRIVKDKSIAGRRIEISEVHDGEGARNCHVLFIDSAQNRQAPRIIEALHGSSVLTVGDIENFLDEGGIINFVLQDDRVQFQISHKAATKANLYVSSRLLGVARRVIE